MVVERRRLGRCDGYGDNGALMQQSEREEGVGGSPIVVCTWCTHFIFWETILFRTYGDRAVIIDASCCGGGSRGVVVSKSLRIRIRFPAATALTLT